MEYLNLFYIINNVNRVAFPGATPVIRDGNNAQNRRDMFVFIHKMHAMYPIHAMDILTF